MCPPQRIDCVAVHAKVKKRKKYCVSERKSGWLRRVLYLSIINQHVLDDWLSCGLPINHPDIVHLVPSDLTVLLGGHR